MKSPFKSVRVKLHINKHGVVVAKKVYVIKYRRTAAKDERAAEIKTCEKQLQDE